MITIPGDGFTICIPQASFGGKCIADQNADVIVHVDDGRQFIATAYTPENIVWLMNKARTAGDVVEGSMFFDPSMIIVRTLDETTLKLAVSTLIAEGQIDKVFTKCLPSSADDDEDDEEDEAGSSS